MGQFNYKCFLPESRFVIEAEIDHRIATETDEATITIICYEYRVRMRTEFVFFGNALVSDCFFCLFLFLSVFHRLCYQSNPIQSTAQWLAKVYIRCSLLICHDGGVYEVCYHQFS